MASILGKKNSAASNLGFTVGGKGGEHTSRRCAPVPRAWLKCIRLAVQGCLTDEASSLCI